MIIDTTISAMEVQMDIARRFEKIAREKFNKKPVWHCPAERHARIQYRESAIRDFLIKQGKKPVANMNYVAFWRDGKITDVHLLSELTDQERNKKYEKHFEELLGKFNIFMRLRQD